MEKIKQCSTLILFLILTSIYTNIFGQNQIKFKDKRINENIKTLFKNNKEIDSIIIEFEKSIPRRLEVFKQPGDIPQNQYHEIVKPALSKRSTFYNLNFDGDMFFLKKEFSSLYQITSNKNLIKKISNLGEEKNFRIVITRDAVYKRNFMGNSILFATFKYKRKEQFIEFLNKNYTDSLKLGGDSILIFQAIVYRNSSLGETALLHGEKILLDFFISNCKIFTKEMSLFSDKALFLPFIKDGTPSVSLIDVFVKINPDKTFIISATGEGRDLKIKNYKNNKSYGNLFY